MKALAAAPAPATNPPTGPVQRPAVLDRPPASPPADLFGPAVPPAAPATTTTPLQSPPALTPEQQQRRRLGFPIVPPRPPIDLTARQGPGTIDFTRG
jgi:hypothetical protein